MNEQEKNEHTLEIYDYNCLYWTTTTTTTTTIIIIIIVIIIIIIIINWLYRTEWQV